MFRFRSGSFTLRSASLACSRLNSEKAPPLPGAGAGGAAASSAPAGVSVTAVTAAGVSRLLASLDIWVLRAGPLEYHQRTSLPQRRTPARGGRRESLSAADLPLAARLLLRGGGLAPR